MSFSGKTALITGATRGIGKAIALRLASDGANIGLAAKSGERFAYDSFRRFLDMFGDVVSPLFLYILR